jgi:hypothetical protein
MYSWRCDDVDRGQTSPISTHFSLFKTQKSLFPWCLRIIAVTLMWIYTSRSAICSTLYRLDANCLVKIYPKSVTMSGVCPSILITHWLGNRGQHLLWRHLRGMLLKYVLPSGKPRKPMPPKTVRAKHILDGDAIWDCTSPGLFECLVGKAIQTFQG